MTHEESIAIIKIELNELINDSGELLLEKIGIIAFHLGVIEVSYKQMKEKAGESEKVN